MKAPAFVLTANEAVEQVYMRIEVSGDLSAAKAMRFGVTTSFNGAPGEGWPRGMTQVVEVGADGYSEPIALGDLLPDDKVKVDVSTWIAAYDLTEYDGGNFTVEVVFSAMES